MLLEEYRDVLASRNESDRRQADAGPVTLGLRLNSSVFPKGWVNIAYGRGTWIMHMLRAMFRDAATAAGEPDPDARFFTALRTFREQFEHKTASTSDFQHVLEEQLPLSLRYEGRRNLDWFFESWVETAVMPRITLQQVKFTRGERTTASFVVEQHEASPDLVTSVPIYAVMPGGGMRYVTRVFAEGKSTRFRLKVPANTRRLVLDPHETILTAEEQPREAPDL
jgi:aminopeptidase N